MEQQTLRMVKDYITNALSKHAVGITPEQLLDSGAIFYMNGNDGTDFDWRFNNRTCEFMVFYKSTNYGIMQVVVTDCGFIKGYYYADNGKADAIHLESQYVGAIEALELKNWLEDNFDDKMLWDKPIDFD